VVGVRLLKQDGGGAALLELPRYEGFTGASLALSRCGAGFVEIAGNRTVITVSATGPLQAALPAGSTVMMRQPIITRPGRERVVLIVPVTALAPTLLALDQQGMSVEHVFDY
jgi:hypothetical protein